MSPSFLQRCRYLNAYLVFRFPALKSLRLFCVSRRLAAYLIFPGRQ